MVPAALFCAQRLSDAAAPLVPAAPAELSSPPPQPARVPATTMVARSAASGRMILMELTLLVGGRWGKAGKGGERRRNGLSGTRASAARGARRRLPGATATSP